MSTVVAMLGTGVLVVVLPCTIILCFFLQHCTDYLGDNDTQASEAFRSQGQEQIRRPGRTSDLGNNEGHLDSVRLSDIFHFHTVQKHGESIFRKTGKDDTECSIDEDETNSISASNSSGNSSNTTINHISIDPSNRMSKVDNIEDDVEECVPFPKPQRSNSRLCSCRSLEILRQKYLGGTDATTNKANQNTDVASTQIARKVVVGDDDDDEFCCICLEVYTQGEMICTPKTGACNHVFHKKCLFEWIKKKHHCCPLCRVVLIEGPRDDCVS